MSKRKKLRTKLKNNPNDATFSDIQKLLEQEGFVLDRIGSISLLSITAGPHPKSLSLGRGTLNFGSLLPREKGWG